MTAASTTPRTTRTTRTRKAGASTNAAPATVPFHKTAEYGFKCQSEDTVSALRDAAVDTVTEYRAVGPHAVFCWVGKMADGSERILLAFVANGEGEFIATVSPLDTEGVMWLSTTLAKGYEQSRHRTALDAVDHARAEAVERFAWTATSYDDVQAAYAAHPRTPACEHCGR